MLYTFLTLIHPHVMCGFACHSVFENIVGIWFFPHQWLPQQGTTFELIRKFCQVLHVQICSCSCYFSYVSIRLNVPSSSLILPMWCLCWSFHCLFVRSQYNLVRMHFFWDPMFKLDSSSSWWWVHLVNAYQIDIVTKELHFFCVWFSCILFNKQFN